MSSLHSLFILLACFAAVATKLVQAVDKEANNVMERNREERSVSASVSNTVEMMVYIDTKCAKLESSLPCS